MICSMRSTNCLRFWLEYKDPKFRKRNPKNSILRQHLILTCVLALSLSLSDSPSTPPHDPKHISLAFLASCCFQFNFFSFQLNRFLFIHLFMSFCIRLPFDDGALYFSSSFDSFVDLLFSYLVGVVVIVAFITIRGFRVRFAFLFLFSVTFEIVVLCSRVTPYNMKW